MNEDKDIAPDENQEWSDEIETWLDEYQEALDDTQDELYVQAESEVAQRPEYTGPTTPIGIRFQPAGKVYHFAAPVEMELQRDDWVVVETVYGEQAGQISETVARLPDGISPKRLSGTPKASTSRTPGCSPNARSTSAQ